MKIALVCSKGGHLTELLRLTETFDEFDVFFVTHRSPRTDSLQERKYFIKDIGTNYGRIALAAFSFLKIFLEERPSVVISTGSEIAIPAFYVARLLRIPTIYIESWCCVNETTGAGRLVYPVSDVFLVQWPSLAEKYGPKADYKGAVI